jgi:SsrA-binding protein
MGDPSTGRKIVCHNKKAAHDYFIDEVYEAGLVLLGPEVKSLREGKVSLVDSYAKMRKGELYLYNMDITPYPYAHHLSLDPKRSRKLLLTKKEIKRITGKTEEKGYTMIPLKVYFSKGWARWKLPLPRARGKWISARRSRKKT